MKKLLILLPAMLWAGTHSLFGQAPAISNFSPDNGPVGTSVTIFGSNFDATPANNVVYFGAVRATVSAASTNELMVEVPAGASYQPITVLTNGLIAASAKPFKVTFDSDLTLADSLASPVSFEVGYAANSVVAGDLNGDGLADLVACNGADNTITVLENSSAGYGDISFGLETDFAVAGEPIDLALADFDGDGKLDIAVGYLNAGFVSVFRNTSGTFLSFDTRQDFAAGSATEAIAYGDLDGDGRLDLVAGDFENNLVYILDNTGTGVGAIAFTYETTYATQTNPLSVAIADIDQDQLLDIVTANNGSSSISVLRNTGSFTFSASHFGVGSDAINVKVGDLDGDDMPDIAVSNTGGYARIFRNTSTAGSLNLSPFDVTPTANDWLTLDDYNGDGKTDIIYEHFWGKLVLRKNESTAGSLTFADVGEIWVDDMWVLYVTSSDLDNDGEPDMILTGDNFEGTAGVIQVRRNVSSDNSFKSFSFIEQSAPATIDLINHTIEIDVQDCTDPTTLVATFELSPNAKAVIPSGAGATSQVSGITMNDFTNPVTYLVTSEDGANQLWTVTVNGNKFANNVTQNIDACESYAFDGAVYAISGQYMGFFTNQQGCDSLVTVNLTILQPTASEETTNACDSYDWNGVTYTTSGTYQEMFTNVAGCDSTAVLNLTILKSSSSEETTTTCDSYNWNGTTYTTSGTYQELLVNSMGCDSTAVLNLTILESTSSEENIETCNNYEWNGTTYTSSGTYQELFTNSVGCDSTAVLNLTINNSIETTLTEAACGSFNFLGTELTSSGSYSETLTTIAGCDSLITLELTIHELPDASVTQNGIVLFAVDNPDYTYQWLDCGNDNNPITGETDRQLTPPRNGNYAVEVSNENCAVVSDCYTIDVITGLNALEEGHIAIYPTVTSSTVVTIESKENMENYYVTVRTLSGKTITSEQLTKSTKQTVQLPNVKGLYIVQISNGSQIIKTQRIIKSN